MFRYRGSVKKKPARGRSVVWRPETVMLLRQFLIGIVSIVVVTGFIVSVWYVTRLSAFTISTIEVSGGFSITPEEVRAAASAPLSGEYFKLIPKTFSFFYPEAEITAAVAAIDKVKNPIVERTSLTALRITFDEYVPYALWCDERAGGDCYYLDDEGVAFSTAPPLSGSAFIRYRTIGRSPARFETLTDREQLQVVEEMVTVLEQQFNFPVISVELDVVGDVFYILQGGSEIKVSKRLSVDETARNLDAVLRAPEFEGLAPGNFPYIDLRFGSKVFVSDEWPVTEVVATTTPDEVVDLLSSTLTTSTENVPSASSVSEPVLDSTTPSIEPDTILPAIVDSIETIQSEEIQNSM